MKSFQIDLEIKDKQIESPSVHSDSGRKKRQNIICGFRDKEQNEQTFHPKFLVSDFFDCSPGYQLPLNRDVPDGTHRHSP